jgi:phytol kinase
MLAADLRGAALLSLLFLALLAAAELWRRVARPDPEWTRKLVHLGGGIVCLFFPFFVRSPWVVLAMASALSALFALGSRLGFLQSLHGVRRTSRGAEYYPLAIFLVFLLARDRPWLYVSCVLVLAVSDALAALIGSRYGVIRYQVEDDSKSLEGSLVFLFTTFLAVHLPALLMTELPRPTVVLAATLVALIVTGLEVVCLQGTDNLYVPLTVYLTLDRITTKPLPEIAYQNLSLLAISAFVALVVWRFRTFNVGGTIGFILFVYAAWSLGSVQWAVPVFLALGVWIVFTIVVPPLPRPGPPTRVRVVFRIVLVPLAVLMAANASTRYAWFYGPYLAASATVIALALWWRLLNAERPLRPRRAFRQAVGVTLLAGAAVVFPPWLLQAGVPVKSLLVTAGLVLPVLLASDLPAVRRSGAMSLEPWSAWRFLMTLATAGVVAALQIGGWIAPWNPS